MSLPITAFDDKQLYKWKDLVSSLSLGIGSAVVASKKQLL
jgi:hypothetical protein